jgi:hypothetical protein
MVEVGLAEIRRQIPCFLQLFHHIGPLGIKITDKIFGNAVLMRMKAGDDRCTRWHAERALAIRSFESQPFVCQTIQGRGLNHIVSGTAYGIMPMLVGKKIHNIRLFATHKTPQM